jgi:GNAT superfamily N-acetyltransferase
MEIRRARPDDRDALARLATELGYPTTPAQMAERLVRIDLDPLHAVFVADGGAGAVAFLHVLETRTLESPAHAEIAGLVVAEGARGRRIGQRLVEVAGDWAHERGLPELRVRSNVMRLDAHRFYEREGFRLAKTQMVYTRRLGGDE